MKGLLFAGMLGVGTLMNPPPPVDTGPPPVSSYRILTEAGDALTTESGVYIVTQ